MRAEESIVSNEHRAYSSHRSPVSYSLPALLLIAGTAFCAQPAAREPLPETAVLDRVDGGLLHVDANDTWFFELTMEVKTPDYRLPAGTRFELLPSAALGRLIADVNERHAPRYRLSARVTQFQGKDFLFPTYYLPLSKFKDDKSPQDSDPNDAQSEIRSPPWDDPELAVPPEILEQLKKQRPLRGPRRSSEAKKTPAQGPPERVIVNHIGRIENGRVGSHPTRPPDQRAPNAWVKNPPYVLVPYALGWNLSGTRYELLPCVALEQALQMQARALDPIRFNVAGLVTQFQGRNYLLLQRAIVVYNYGNFGR